MLLIAFAREERSHATDTQEIRCTVLVRRNGLEMAKVALHSPRARMMLPFTREGQQVPLNSFDPMDRLSRNGQRARKMILLFMSLSLCLTRKVICVRIRTKSAKKVAD